MKNILTKWLSKYRIDFAVLIFFLPFLPFFFYHLGAYSLVDFDEAWFAEIARNILKSSQPFLLTFNGVPFTDHPPFGYTLISLSLLLFGVNEFAARFPSAIMGFGSLILLYLIGKNLFNRAVGMAAGLILVSSVWYLYRTRTADLDSIFLFFLLLTFYSAVKTIRTPKWFIVGCIFFALLLQIKSAIGLIIIIPVFVYFLVSKVRIPIRLAVWGLLAFILTLFPWVLFNFHFYGIQYFIHYFQVGLRPGYRIVPNIAQILSTNTFVYLHYGMTKWYYPALIALIGSLIHIRAYKNLIPIYSIVFALLFGFLTNTKTEIWHLIPLYPFFALLIGFFAFQVFRDGFKIAIVILKKKQPFPNRIISFLMLFFILAVCGYQMYLNRFNVKLTDTGMSDLAYVSSIAKNYSELLYLDGHDFLPSTVFYSQKKVYFTKTPPVDTLKGLIANGPKPYLLLTEKWRLDTDKIDTNLYTVIAKKNDRLLIRVL